MATVPRGDRLESGMCRITLDQEPDAGHEPLIQGLAVTEQQPREGTDNSGVPMGGLDRERGHKVLPVERRKGLQITFDQRIAQAVWNWAPVVRQQGRKVEDHWR